MSPPKRPEGAPPDPEQMLSSQELARLLSVSRRTVLRMARKGELPSPVRVTGSVVRWWREEVVRFLRSRPLDRKEAS